MLNNQQRHCGLRRALLLWVISVTSTHQLHVWHSSSYTTSRALFSTNPVSVPCRCCHLMTHYEGGSDMSSDPELVPSEELSGMDDDDFE